MMMAAAKKIDWLTSAAAIETITAYLPRKPLRHAHDDAARAAPAPRCAERLGQMTEDVLDHDDRGIHDQAEIDGADRQQIGRLAPQHHEADGEGQRERDRHADDHGAAQIAEERPLQQEDQQRCPPSMLCSTVCVVTRIRSLRS